jgi:hypothetical protein
VTVSISTLKIWNRAAATSHYRCGRSRLPNRRSSIGERPQVWDLYRAGNPFLEAVHFRPVTGGQLLRGIQLRSRICIAYRGIGHKNPQNPPVKTGGFLYSDIGIPKSIARRRRALLGRMQLALKPTSKTLGLHGIFVRGKDLKDMIAYSAFKRVQVDARACWRDTGEPHRGLTPRAGGTLNRSEWNDGRQGFGLGHDASLAKGGSTTLSVTGSASEAER